MVYLWTVSRQRDMIGRPVIVQDTSRRMPKKFMYESLPVRFPFSYIVCKVGSAMLKQYLATQRRGVDRKAQILRTKSSKTGKCTSDLECLLIKINFSTN